MIDVKETLVWHCAGILGKQIKTFLQMLGTIEKDLSRVFFYLIRLKINLKAVVEQSSRFAVDSLPITLTIVGMTSVIISMQISPELAKQGAENYIGMLSALVMIRELASIMAGFAIISMIGSSFASELASMSVGEQIAAMRVLRVDPVEYLIVPRFLAGVIMMPIVFVIASFTGLVCSGLVAHWTADLSILNYIDSLWHGLYVRDIMIALLKSAFFGGTIALISCSTGYSTRGGAKEVGEATTTAVVWSFLAIAIWDYIFATIFYL